MLLSLWDPYATMRLYFLIGFDSNGDQGNIRVYCGSLMGWIFQGKDRGKDGMHASVTSDLIFNNVKVPKENLLGEEEKALRLPWESWMQAVSPLLLQGLGIAAGCLDQAIAYSKERGYSLESLSASCRIGIQTGTWLQRVQATRLLEFYDAADRVAGPP